MTTPNNDEMTTTALVEMFSAFIARWQRWLPTTLGDAALSPARIRLLARLRFKGPQLMGRLSQALDVTPRNVTVLVDGLEADGLVARLPDPTDRRATRVTLTEAGAALCDELWERHLREAGRLFETLDAEERGALATVMQGLSERLRHLAPDRER